MYVACGNVHTRNKPVSALFNTSLVTAAAAAAAAKFCLLVTVTHQSSAQAEMQTVLQTALHQAAQCAGKEGIGHKSRWIGGPDVPQQGVSIHPRYTVPLPMQLR
jgi:hypothetical protein